LSPVGGGNSKNNRRVEKTGWRVGEASDLHKSVSDYRVRLSGCLHSIDISVGQPYRERPGSFNLGQGQVATHGELPCHTYGFGGSTEESRRQVVTPVAQASI
jgi:hypothetical protein